MALYPRQVLTASTFVLRQLVFVRCHEIGENINGLLQTIDFSNASVIVVKSLGWLINQPILQFLLAVKQQVEQLVHRLLPGRRGRQVG